MFWWQNSEEKKYRSVKMYKVYRIQFYKLWVKTDTTLHCSYYIKITKYQINTWVFTNSKLFKVFLDSVCLLVYTAC